MTFFDTYGNNGDIVNQVLTDVQVIQCALGEKVKLFFTDHIVSSSSSCDKLT